MRIQPVTILAICIACATAASAEQLASYYATISVQDRYNSSGTRLGDFGAMIQQDRANYHRFGKRDIDDRSDPYFGDRATRALIPQLYAAAQAGDPYWAGIAAKDFDMPILVQICGSGGKITHIRVDPADGDGYGDC